MSAAPDEQSRHDSPRVARPDGRHGARARNPALCCECGTLRLVAVTFYGRKPSDAAELAGGHDLNWLKCSTCAEVTPHAQIRDFESNGRPTNYGSKGCYWERDNRDQTAARAELPALLKTHQDQGVTIEWVHDLPGWEKRNYRHGWEDVILAEVDRREGGHHLRLVVDAPATKVVGALRKILPKIKQNALDKGHAYGFCGCGWDITVCSYCPGQEWRWKGQR